MSEAVESGNPEKSFKSENLPGFPGPIVVRARMSRVAILAVAMALSAAAGSTVGAMAASMFVKPQPLSFDDAKSIEVNNLRGVITQLSAEMASLKASIDNNSKSANAQFAKLAERVDRAQVEPSQRVLKLSELVEKIERRTAAAPAQAQAQVQPPAPTLASAPDVTGSVAPKQQDRPAVVTGWIIREVFDGRAMVEHDRLGFYEVVPGANLPGIGRVETIKRQDGRWVVVTPKGLILSQRIER
jgi:hypothetical protein